MPALAIHPIVDTSVGGRLPAGPGVSNMTFWNDEVTFQSAAQQFCRHHPNRNIGRVEFRERDSTDFRQRILDYVQANGRLSLIAVFGHGAPQSFISAAIGKIAIAGLLEQACQLQATIIFYACSCGQLGRASVLGYTLAGTAMDFRLYGHMVSGPAHGNPFKSRFVTDQPDGREMIRLSIGDLADVPRFRSEWNANFRNVGTWLWADYPFLPPPEVGRRACHTILEEARVENRRLLAGNAEVREQLPALYRVLQPDTSTDLSVRRTLAREGSSAAVRRVERQLGLDDSAAWPAFPAQQLIGSDPDMDYFAIAVAQWQHRHNAAEVNGQLNHATLESIRAGQDR